MNLRIYEATISHREGGSFDFVVLADNKEHAKRIVYGIKNSMGYTRVNKLKFIAMNDGSVYERFDNIAGAY